MSPRIGPGKKRLELSVDKDVLAMLRIMHRGYNHRTGLSLSFNKYIEGVFTHYLRSSGGMADNKAGLSIKR